MLQIYRGVTRFTEDFDFIAMNEKFKKDEVWGHIGKSKAQSRDKGDAIDDSDDTEDDDVGSSKFNSKVCKMLEIFRTALKSYKQFSLF